MLDTIQVPFWDGNPNDPYPSVTVRLDFHGADTGQFVYHCHIAGHEDAGMMAIIKVMPSSTAAALEGLRIRFASIGWFGASDATAGSAWCVRGRSAARPSRQRSTGGDRQASGVQVRSS